MNLLYLIGEPGVGKSTLMAELVKGKRRRVMTKPFAHTVYEDGLVQLGRERSNGFSGTDALSMSVSPLAITTLQSGAWPRIVGEGDRLAHAKFFDGVLAAGYALEVVLLEAPSFVLKHRRRERGSNQDASWLAGRATKVRNVADKYTTTTLDATLPVADLADLLRDYPVFQS